jgi:predicted TIM-barrel fold metal-dependent hydrolase
MEIIDANTMFGPWPRIRANMSLERLQKALELFKVSKVVTLSSAGIFHSYNDGNADTLAMCKGKDKCLPAATIDPRGYFPGMKLISTLVSQGFRLFRFFPNEQGWPLDHAVFEDILDEMEPTSVPVMINAANTGDASALGRMIGGKQHPLILEGVKFETLAEAVSVMKKHSNIYVETHSIIAPGALRFLYDQVGVDRIIYGSDSPRCSMAGALNYVQESGLSDEDREKVLGSNLKRLLGG